MPNKKWSDPTKIGGFRLLTDKRKHKSLKEWCWSTRWISCRNLRYSNPRCFGMRKRHIFCKVVYKTCTGGRVGLMHQIANLAYMRIHVTWGRSPSCTLLLRYRNGYNGVVLKTIVSLWPQGSNPCRSVRLSCDVFWTHGLISLFNSLRRRTSL